MRYDAIIIGTGQSGFPLAGALAERGMKVAVAEGGNIGGTCINSGCSPTKTIVASARAAHVARRGADFGVNTGEITINWDKVISRKDAIVHKFRSGVENWLTSLQNLTLYRHYASFVGPQQVQVGDEVIESERIYINTGGRAFVPPIEGLENVPFLDNLSILELKEIPQHLIVIGGGYIGMEYGQAFRRFGSQVTMIDRGKQIMGREDADIAAAGLALFEQEGIRVYLNTATKRVEAVNGSVRVIVERDGQTEEIVGSHLLMAVGRKPNSDGLNLPSAGIQTDARGYITVDDHLKTSAEGVWAMGDVNGRGAFTHTSYNDFEIILDNLDGGNRNIAGRIPVYAVYIDPPLGRVGMSESKVRASGRKALMGVKPMSHIARAQERDETHGLMKVLVDAGSNEFLGAAIFGIGGDEIIHSIIDLMYAKAPYTVMKNAVHIHPTVSELLPTLLGELRPLE
ncbi:MAG: FAD-containing oxidoreductase [Anaerolineae bacterium]